MWNMFKVYNKDTIVGVFIANFELWTYFTPYSSVSTVNFKKVNAGWENCRMMSMADFLLSNFYGVCYVGLEYVITYKV